MDINITWNGNGPMKTSAGRSTFRRPCKLNQVILLALQFISILTLEKKKFMWNLWTDAQSRFLHTEYTHTCTST